MRVVAQTNGFRFLQKLGARLGLAEQREIRPKSEPEPVVETYEFPFRELQTSISVVDNGDGVHSGSLTLVRRRFEAPAETPIVQEIRDNLRNLLEVLDPEMVAESARIIDIAETLPRIATKVPPYITLHEKRIAFIGISGVELRRAQDLFALQGCVCEPVDEEDSLDGYDIVLFAAPGVWESTDPIDASGLLQITRPVLVTGQRRLLTRISRLPHTGPRDYLSYPWPEEELAWRASLLAERAGNTSKDDVVPKREKSEILIANDDVAVRTLLASLLGKHGMICHVAENGAEAIELFRSVRPCAAVMDVMMTGMDGFQVLAAVKQDPVLYRTPVLLLTARNAEVDKLQAFALGADDYMTKPFSPMELAVRLKRLLRQRS